MSFLRLELLFAFAFSPPYPSVEEKAHNSGQEVQRVLARARSQRESSRRLGTTEEVEGWYEGEEEGLTDPLALIVCDLVTGDELCRREEGPFTRQSLLDLSPAKKRGRVRVCTRMQVQVCMCLSLESQLADDDDWHRSRNTCECAQVFCGLAVKLLTL